MAPCPSPIAREAVPAAFSVPGGRTPGAWQMNHLGPTRLVATSLPNHSQVTLIFTVVVVMIVALAVTAPYAAQATAGTESFVPAYAAAVCVIEITTGALLLATFRVQRMLGLWVLGLGYLLSGFLVPAWALTFPGIFSALGLDENLQATAWIAVFRRIGFALAVLFHALCPAGVTVRSPGRWIVGGLAGILLAVALILSLALGQTTDLPPLMTDARRTAPAWALVPPLTIALYVTAILALLYRRQSTLDIWMTVVVCSLLFELLLLSYLAEGVRLSIGWWAGRIFGLFAAGIILLVLLAETAGNYMRLAETAAAEIRTRRNRTAAMEALSATIAHEINQPLASMVTNADAGVRWLSHEQPDIVEARAALGRIVEDGHRASRVIAGIRAMFANSGQVRSPVDLKSLVDDAVKRCQSERTAALVEIERLFPSQPVFVTCDPVQMLQVCLNLIENAVDGPRRDDARASRVSIRIRCLDRNEVEVSVIDDGPGVPDDVGERIFQPFVSTKPNGMGMGLMLCRTVIEAHGGRIWFTPVKPRGAAFHFTLPLVVSEGPTDDR